MNALPVTAPSGINLGDVYFTLFRHKWKILFCSALGLAAAVMAYRVYAPPYQSEAKLFVRYIVSENKTFGATNNDASAKSPDQRGETIMKSESEILGSMDLARQVAEAIGPEKVLAKYGGGKNLNAASAVIRQNLDVYVAPATSIITVTFRHLDPDLVQPVLRELIERYRKLHVEIHMANGMLLDFLSQETDQLKSRLSQTEEELRRATLKAGIISLEDAKSANSQQLTAIRRELFNAQTELAQRAAVLEALKKRGGGATGATDLPVVPPEVMTQYRGISQQADNLQKMEQELLTQYTPNSDRVKEIRALLADAREKQTAIEAQHPTLAVTFNPNHSASGIIGAPDPEVLSSQITSLQAKIKALTGQLDEIHRDAAKVEQMEGTIVDLRRKKELEDANYRYYAASLEQSRIKETFSNGRVSNINTVQSPSPPFSDRSKSNKIIAMIAVGGCLGGIIWAFLIELYFDRSIRRTVDLERMLRVPLFISIPALGRKQLKSSMLLLQGPNGHGANGHGSNGKNGHHAAPSSPLEPFHETLRDRLIGYFKSIDLTHKPKLVAVTGLGRNAGVSTTAAGLARSLSETGEGNVLLVDMNDGEGVSQQFMKGKPVCGLDQMLEARDDAQVKDNLYVVTENNDNERLSRNMQQRFSKLVPRLKASDFDYIIFDMPPVSQISITPRLTGYMDMVLLVVESEKADRDLVQRASTLLAASRTHVGIVLNKTKRYVPVRLLQDNLGNS